MWWVIYEKNIDLFTINFCEFISFSHSNHLAALQDQLYKFWDMFRRGGCNDPWLSWCQWQAIFRSVAKDKAGRVQGTSENVITYGDIQNLQGKAFGAVFIESETMCGADRTWMVQVKRAVLVVDGKREDLLKGKKVQIDDFQPMRIKVGQ